MTIALAIEYIPNRMKDFGFEQYALDFRHFVLQPSETKVVSAFNQFYLLISELSNISITSYTGDYDLSNPGIDEQTYEHQGLMIITNNGSSPAHIQFIHLTPND